jgi:hypothetical protein
MTKSILLLGVAVLAACKSDITDKKAGDPSTTNPQTASVLTQHNDNSRAGWNNNETALTTSNVNAQHFGKLFSLAVDDQVYAQPLVAGGITINNGVHNVVYIATVNNTLFAYDGDNGKLYWQKNFTAAGMRPPKNTDMTGACSGNYSNFSRNIGIVGTPVIDAAKHTIYFVARSMKDSNTFVQHLHAVDIVSGMDVAGSPVGITATSSGSGDGSVNNVITFDPQRQNQRQGLTLLNGMVYVTFSSHCDWGPYHGWILGYDAATLEQLVVYNATPDGYAGGLWQSGAGMSADAQGNLYVVTGNGTVGTSSDPTNVRNRGESALKLTPAGGTLQVASFFTPANYQYLNDNDLDYGSPGAFLIPNSSYYLTAAKDGTIFLLNKDNMGGYQSSGNLVQQVISLGPDANLHSQLAYFKGTTKEYVYIWSENDELRAIPFNRASNMLDQSRQVVFSPGQPTGQTGAMLSVSSNGSLDGTGIVWASHAFSGDAESSVSPGILRAFDANDVTYELWDNLQNGAQDGAGNFAKFAPPTIANGHVYLPTFSNQVVVYGLR